MPLWALHGYLEAIGGDKLKTTQDYNITPDELNAATSLIDKYRPYFDAYLLVRNAPMIDNTLATPNPE